MNILTILTFLLVAWTIGEVFAYLVEKNKHNYRLATDGEAGSLGFAIGGLAIAGAISSYFGKRSADKAANRAFPDFLQYRNEILMGPGGFAEQMQAMRNDPLLLEAQTNLFRKAPGIIDTLEGDLKTGALARTSGARVSALENARVAAGSRGGLAFGGGARSVAEAGARAAAPTQAAALADALAQASGMRLQNIQAQGDFAFNKRAQELALRQQFLAGAFSLAGGGQQAMAQANQAKIGGMFNLGSNLIGGGLNLLAQKG